MTKYPLPTRRLIAPLVSVFVLSTASVLPALAQKPATPATAPEPAEILSGLWQKEQSSRILIVVPQTSEWSNSPYARIQGWSREKESAKAKPAPRSVADWLQANQSVLRSFGSISAIGDRIQARPATRLGLPDYLDTGNAWQNKRNAMDELLASLTESQWRLITSPQGMGWDALAGSQGALWEVAVPNPFVVDRKTDKYSRAERAKENTHTLTDAERRQVHLRVKLIGSIDAAYVDGKGNSLIIFNKNRSERNSRGETFLFLRETGAYDRPHENRDDGVFAYGQYLTRNQPNTPKPLPESFAARLAPAPVLLPKPTDNPVTFGKLLDDINAAMGTNLYAAAKMRALSVLITNNGSVPADSLLRALLFATNNTVRVVPPLQTGDKELYVISPEAEPAGRIAGQIADWYFAAEGRGWKTDTDDQIAQNNPVPLLRFDADDPAAMTDAQWKEYLKTVQQKRQDGQPARDVHIKVTLESLPPAVQKEVNDRAKDVADLTQKNPDNDFRVRVDSLSMSCGAWFSYILPGSGNFAGELDNDPVGEIANWLPKSDTAPGETAQGRVVALSAESVEEARSLLAAAQKVGVKEIWLQASPEIVAGAVDAASGVPVRAIVSLLRVQADTPENLPREENLYGKKSKEWLVPDDPAVIRYAAERVRVMAAVPGIAGIVLRGTVPPGYRGAHKEEEKTAIATGELETDYVGGNGNALGYSLTHRRAYLQETGQDPADIIQSVPLEMGWQEDAEGMSAWQDWRHQQTRDLWDAVRKETVGKSVLVEGGSAFRERGSSGFVHVSLFVPWEATKRELLLSDLFLGGIASFPRFSKIPGMVVCVAGNPGVRTSARELTYSIRRADKPQETLWDLTDRRLPGTKERIRTLTHP